jgi:predicted porin
MVTATAQAKPKLALGGWFEGIVGVVDDDLGNTGAPGAKHVGVDVQQDSEIHFNGSVTLDNGIKIRTRTELEAQSANSTDTIDEAYMDISGSFGAIRIGSEDSVAHLMTSSHQGSWAVQVGQNLQLDTGDWIEAPAGHTASTSVRLSLGDGDSEKITYFTPRVAGFQAGVSYLPSFSEGDNSEPEGRAENFHDGWSLGANYRGKFGSVSVGAAAGYTVMKPASNGQDQSDPKGWGVSASLGVAGFKVAAGYTAQKNLSNETGGGPTAGDDAYDIGAHYKWGKNNVSVAWVHSEDDSGAVAGGASEDTSDAVMVSYRRDLAPGVQYRLNFIHADYEGATAGSGDDNEGIALTTSVRLAF